jgi:hypothetical protein
MVVQVVVEDAVDEAECSDADRLSRELALEFAGMVDGEELRDLVREEWLRWQACTVMDYVPIFVRRRMRSQLGRARVRMVSLES